ncbi:Adenylate kinase 8 [Physocladia obscura]|uniref:Adenylate kinase 8 n=1 Tax=Physocladia obscura TaxID=109957 RepID=A0AAD5T006_9FUNG|nr:Adenylate kinase 8 [Physocladia obscura]
MDSILDPTKVDAFAAYADRHELFDIFENLVKSVIVEMPDDPLQAMIDHLQKPAEKVAQTQKCVAISANALLLTAIERATSLGQQARAYMEKGQLVPDQVILNIILQRLQEPDAVAGGFIIEGFPVTKEQATALQMRGVFLTNFVWIDCDDSAVIQYNVNLTTDPVLKRNYHPKYSPAPEDEETTSRLVHREYNQQTVVTKRLHQYRRAIASVVACFQRSRICTCLRYMDEHGIWGRVDEVIRDVVATLVNKKVTRAPRQFKIILHGLPGSGKSSLAEEIERKYGFVHVSPQKIILEHISANTRNAKQLIEYIHDPENVPEDVMLNLIVQRLQKDDCKNQGWVVEGFPNTSTQAESLKEKGVIPNRLIWLRATEETCKLRVTARRQDPLTGRLANLANPPNDVSVCQIEGWPMRDAVADNEETVLASIKRRQNLKVELERFYGYRKKVVTGGTKWSVTNGIMQEIDTEGLGEKDARGRHRGIEKVMEVVDDILMKPMDGNNQKKLQQGSECQHEHEDVEHLFNSLLNGGEMEGDFDTMFGSSFGAPVAMQMPMSIPMPDMDLHGINFDMGGLNRFDTQPTTIVTPKSSSPSTTAATAANCHSAVPLPLLPAISVIPVMPAPSARVQQALASDIASEVLVLLEGPTKKKPGRKKKGSKQTQNTTAALAVHTELHHSIKTEHITVSSSASISDSTFSKKRKLAATPPNSSTLVSPGGLTSDSTKKSMRIADQSLENSVFLSTRKLSISSTEYLNPLPVSMSPNSNSLTLSPQRTQVIPSPVLTKHQERMMKNRASADESRKKHKDHVEKLEKICRELVVENEALKKRVLEVEKWAEQAVQQQATATAAMASFTPASGSNVSACSVSPPSIGCDSISIDGFLSDVSFGNLPSPAFLPAANSINLFEMFFRGSDYFPTSNSSAGLLNQTKGGVKGTILLAFLFSFSMLVFPTSLFQQSSPQFYASTPIQFSHHSSAAAIPTPASAYLLQLFKSPVSNGISSYIPRVFAPTSSNRQKPSLDGKPALPLIDSGSIQGDTLVVYTPLLQTSSNKLLDLPGHASFLTIGPTTSSPHSPAASRPTRTVPESPCVVVTSAGNTPVTLEIEALLALVSVNAGGNGMRVSKSRLEALRALLIRDSNSIATNSKGKTGVTIIPVPTSLASVDGSSEMKHRTDLITQGRSLAFDNEAERDNDLFYHNPQASVVVEEVNAVVVPGMPPIKEDGDRASVKRRNIARNRVGGGVSERNSDIVSKINDVIVPRFSESGSTVAGVLYENEEYCPIVNGPVLSIVADLGGVSEEETAEEKIKKEENEQSGYRLLLDVRVVGVKLVRY